MEFPSDLALFEPSKSMNFSSRNIALAEKENEIIQLSLNDKPLKNYVCFFHIKSI